jgi:hypothetical protein
MAIEIPELTCVTQGTFQDALTRGKRYLPIEIDHEKQQVRVQGDNGRVRWFPFYCFAFDGSDALSIVSFSIEDFTLPLTHTVEVVMTLSNGERRWCCFATPQQLYRIGKLVEGTSVHVSYGSEHLIVIGSDTLTHALIEQALHHIEAQNMLLRATRLLNDGG